MARKVNGHGPRPCKLMLTGEAPGRFEDMTGIPFSGPSGETLDWTLWKVGLERAGCFVNNLLRYRPPGDRDPWPQEVERDEPDLWADLEQVKPSIICSLGTFATRWYLGEDVDMEMVHGFPQPWPLNPKVTIVPAYHPAAGMRDPAIAKQYMDDLAALARVARGERVGRPPDAVPRPRYREVIGEALPGLLPGLPVAIDTEGTREYPYGLSFSQVPGEGWVILATNKEGLAAFARAIVGFTVLIHNAMWDLPVLAALGIRINPARLRETMVESYLIQDLPKGLKPLAYRLHGMAMVDYDDLTSEYGESQALNYLMQIPELVWPPPEPTLKLVKGKWQVTQPQDIGRRTKAALTRFAEKGAKLRKWWFQTDEAIRGAAEATLGPMPRFTLDLVPRAEVIRYAGRDADATVRVAPNLEQRIRELGLTYARDLDTAIIPMLVAMQEAGMPVNVPKMVAFGEELQGEMDTIRHRIEVEFNQSKPFNPQSGEQTAWLLFERIGLKSRRMTKGGTRLSTDDKALEALKAETRHPAVLYITDWRERAKIKNDFCNKIPRMVDEDQRVRGRIKNTTVVSGRLSMEEPPMMAIPRRSELGRRLRDCFECRPGRCFVGGDLNQIEMRVLAHESRDEFLIRLFREGRDIHDESAAWIFDCPIGEVDRATQRDPSKRIGFGVITGITEVGLYDQLRLNGVMKSPGVWYSKEECRWMIERWFTRYPGVKRYQLACRSEAKRHGRIQAADGRHRWLPWCSGPVYWVREEQLRQSHSLTIQGGMVKIIKEIMIELWARLQQSKLDAMPLLQIHDELILECALRDKAKVEALLLEVMESDSKLSVPVRADIHSATSWGALK